MNKGFIYILVNPVMKGIVKIGKSKRTSEERAKEISRTTGVPMNFDICADFLVEDCDLMETTIHKELDQYRINNRKEFFSLELKEAIKKVEEIIRFEEINSMKTWWRELSIDWKKALKLEIADFIYEENSVFKLDKHDIEKVTSKMLERIINITDFGKYQYDESIQDIKPLARLKKLQTLNLSRTRIKSLSPLKELYSLYKLDCSKTLIESLSPLQNLSDLKELIVSETKVESLKPLNNHKDLKIIDISCTVISDLSPLKNVIGLEELYLNQTNVQSLAPLLSLPNLSLICAVQCRELEHYYISDFKSKRKDCELIVTLDELRKRNTTSA